jgi:hypothetical protein
MGITLEIQNLDKIADMFAALPEKLEAGVKVVGDATAYSLVWEHGSARMHKPGPKTVLSTNPAGQPAILSLQAPHGYIRINRQQYIEILHEQFSQLKLDGAPRTWTSKLTKFLNTSADLCADVISETAPVDSGLLSESIKLAKVGDASLAGTPNSYGPTELDITSDSWM